MNETNFKIGDKIILVLPRNDLYISQVTKINKLTVSLSCGNTLKKSYYGMCLFYRRWTSDRVRVKGLFRGESRYPISAFSYTDGKYEVMKSDSLDTLKKEKNYNLLMSAQEKAIQPFLEFRNAEMFTMQLKCRSVYIKHMCETCKNYLPNGRCKEDNDFYSVGVLATSEKNFFDGSTMCRWQPKS